MNESLSSYKFLAVSYLQSGGGLNQDDWPRACSLGRDLEQSTPFCHVYFRSHTAFHHVLPVQLDLYLKYLVVELEKHVSALSLGGQADVPFLFGFQSRRANFKLILPRGYNCVISTSLADFIKFGLAFIQCLASRT